LDNIVNDPNVPEADDSFTPDVFGDTYLNMELAIPRDSDGPEFAKVTKRLRDKDGLPIGKANDNRILDTRMYQVEYPDGHKASLAANAIAENMFAQVAWSLVRQSVACNDSSYRRYFYLWGLILVTRLPSQRGPQRNLTPEQRREAD
jgi:hypothetical protein